MKADYDPDTKLWTAKKEDRQREYKDLIGAFGWGDPGQEGDYRLHAMLVIGFDKAGQVRVLGEFLGTMDDLKVESVNLKDRFSLKEIHCEPDPEEYRRQLEDLDGLTEYQPKYFEKGKGLTDGRRAFKHPGSWWPHFRNRKTLAMILPVDEDLMAEFDAHISKTYDAAKAGVIRVADWCVKTKLLIREDFNRGRNHPILKALVIGTTALMQAHEPIPKRGEKEPTPWYGR